MKKICIMLPTIIPGSVVNGGVPKVFINTCIALRDRGYNITAIVHKSSVSVKNVLETEPNIDVKAIDFEVPTLAQDFGGISSLAFFNMLLKLIYSILRIRLFECRGVFENFLVHDVTGSVYCWAISAKEKYVYLHSYRSFTAKKTRLLIWLITKLFSKKYISPTVDIKKQMLAINPSLNIAVMETPLAPQEKLNGLYKSSHSNSGQNKFRFVYVGRISPVKNLLDMVDFVDQLKSRKANVELDLYGEAMSDEQHNYLEELKVAVKSKGLSKEISFHGYTDDLVQAFKGHDYSLIFSDGEAIPMAGLESLLNGVPVIGYDRPGVNDLIGNDERGLCFEHKNINQGVTKLLNSNHEYNAFETYIKKYSCESWADRYCKFVF